MFVNVKYQVCNQYNYKVDHVEIHWKNVMKASERLQLIFPNKAQRHWFPVFSFFSTCAISSERLLNFILQRWPRDRVKVINHDNSRLTAPHSTAVQKSIGHADLVWSIHNPKFRSLKSKISCDEHASTWDCSVSAPKSTWKHSETHHH